MHFHHCARQGCKKSEGKKFWVDECVWGTRICHRNSQIPSLIFYFKNRRKTNKITKRTAKVVIVVAAAV
jgi:hypothetical protein